MKIPKIEYNKLYDGGNEIHISFSNKCLNTIGIFPPNAVTDDKIHRFGKHGECWYVLHESKRGTGTIYGYYGDWSSPENKQLFFCSREQGLTTQEKEDAKRQQRDMEREKEEIRKRISVEMLSYYNSLPMADDHPYLEKKGVFAMPDLRIDGDLLIIPLYDVNGKIQTLQKIDERGEKKLYYGLSSSSVRYVFSGSTRVFLCEGYATGASIHEATGATVVCAMFAGNLPKVARDYKGATVIADNDESKTGETKAEECRESDCDYILIPNLGWDANDYASAYGREALKELLLGKEEDEEDEDEDDYFIDAIDMLKQPTFPPYLIKGMFSCGQIGMMVGASGTGKTFSLLDMALTLTTGLGEWNGHKCKKANVCYLCGEGYDGIKLRIKAWLIEHGLRDEDVGNLFCSKYSKDLTNNKDLTYIIEKMARRQKRWGTIDLVIIDTYNQFNSGDENAADSAHAFLANIGEIQRAFSSCLILSHHTGLGQDAQRRARGSSVMHGAMDFVFLLEKDPDNDHFFSLSTIKQKDIEAAPPMGFELKQVSLGWYDPDGEECTSCVAVSRDMKEAKKLTAPCFEIYSLFKDYWVNREEHIYAEEGGFWLIPRADMEEFVMLWKRVKDGKEITRESAYRSLIGDREIGKLLGEKLQKGDRGYYLLKKPSYTETICV